MLRTSFGQLQRWFSQYLDFFAPSDSRFSNSCISAKYCPILPNKSYLFSFQIMYKSQFQKCTLMTGFVVQGRGLHGSKNSLEPKNPKRPVNMLHGTDPEPYFIWKWDPNPCRPEKCLKCRLLPGPDHYSKVGPEPGWEDTDPTAPVPIGTYCIANAIKSINKLRIFIFLPCLTTVSSPLPDCDAYNPLCQ